MRKRQWLIVIVALSLGVLLGMSTLALATDPQAPAILLAKVGLVNGAATAKAPPASSAATTTNSTQTNPAASGVMPWQDQTNGAQANAGQTEGNSPTPGSTGNTDLVPVSVAEPIVTDYKRDIGILFDAWKGPDIQTFRTKLAEGYAGELFERHARRAEEYLTQGIGLYINAVGFDQVVVEKADAATATLRADYHYTAQDYRLGDAVPTGEKNEHKVHVRVNLVKMNQHWLIAGETLLNL